MNLDAIQSERAAVVAWLRAEAEAFAGTRTEQGAQRANSLALAADRIERGEHRPEDGDDDPAIVVPDPAPVVHDPAIAVESKGES